MMLLLDILNISFDLVEHVAQNLLHFMDIAAKLVDKGLPVDLVVSHQWRLMMILIMPRFSFERLESSMKEMPDCHLCLSNIITGHSSQRSSVESSYSWHN